MAKKYCLMMCEIDQVEQPPVKGRVVLLGPKPVWEATFQMPEEGMDYTRKDVWVKPAYVALLEKIT